MPDINVAGAGAGAAGAGGAGAGAAGGAGGAGGAKTTPAVSFGDGKSGGAGGAGDQGGAGQGGDQGQGGEQKPLTDKDFKFEFEGAEEGAAADPDLQADPSGTNYDVTKAFDPKLAEALKNDPQALRQTKRLWYENREFKNQGFKTPEELKAHVAQITELADSLGRQDGTKGLEALAAEAKEWATVYAGFQAGDPAVLDQWFKDNPEGLIKLVPAALDKLYQQAPQVWAHREAKVFMSQLGDKNNVKSALYAINRMYDIAQSNPEAVAYMEIIAKVINDIDSVARKTPQAGGGDQNISEERKQLEKGKRDLYLNKVHAQVRPTITRAAEQAAKVILRGRKMSDEALKTFNNDVDAAYRNLCAKDKDFNDNATAYLKAGETEKFDKLVKAAIKKYMPAAARQVYQRYAGFSGLSDAEKAARRAEGQGHMEGAAGGSQGKPKTRYTGQMIQGAPDPKSIDWARMRAEWGRSGSDDHLMEHEFYVKGKKELYYW